jgi:leader peptidase (prepilin peptidase)/N-methyltransferase
MLSGKCRTCHCSISFLYPFIELLTVIVLTLLYTLVPHHYFFAYFIFFSALIVTIRSDLETMLISRVVTLFLAPLGCIMSAGNLLPLTLRESILGALFGYLFLFSINSIFKYLRNIEGIGEGDFDLILLIGSFTGIIGCWMSITVGSIFGSFCGLLYLVSSKQSQNSLHTKIPFGPFLAFGAIVFVLAHNQIFYYLICH